MVRQAEYEIDGQPHSEHTAVMAADWQGNQQTGVAVVESAVYDHMYQNVCSVHSE